MKSERRHELQHNELADWIGRSYESVRPYANLVLLLVALGLLVAAAWIWWSRQASAGQAVAWNELYRAQLNGSPAEVQQVAENHPNTDVAHWATAIAGDMYLATGCEQLFTNKATAAQDLRKAVDSYLTVLNESQTPMLRERATFGLARAYEALSGTRQSQGELDKAIENYRTVVEKWPNGAYTEIATQRLEDLQRSATKQFYDKFAQYDPKPAYTEQPGTPGEKLPFSTDALPDFSDLPKAPDETVKPPQPESTPSENSAATPIPGEPAAPASATPEPPAQPAPTEQTAPMKE